MIGVGVPNIDSITPILGNRGQTITLTATNDSVPLESLELALALEELGRVTAVDELARELEQKLPEDA